MPRAPRPACPRPGCPHRQPCPIHRPAPRNFIGSTYRTRSAIPRKLRQQILQRDNHTCVLCGQPANVVDHIAPRAWGGSDHPDNLQSICERCSRRKSSSEGGQGPRGTP